MPDSTFSLIPPDLNFLISRKFCCTSWPHSHTLAQCIHTDLVTTTMSGKDTQDAWGLQSGECWASGREGVPVDQKQAFPEASSLAWLWAGPSIPEQRVLVLERRGQPCLTLTVDEGADEGSALTGAKKIEAFAQWFQSFFSTPISTTRPSAQALGPHQCVQFRVSTVPGGSSRACSSKGRVRPQGRES